MFGRQLLLISILVVVISLIGCWESLHSDNPIELNIVRVVLSIPRWIAQTIDTWMGYEPEPVDFSTFGHP